jgi:hypothetical protein
MDEENQLPEIKSRRTDDVNELREVFGTLNTHAERLMRVETRLDTVINAQTIYEKKTDDIVDKISQSLDRVVLEFRDFRTTLMGVWKTTLVIVPIIITLIGGIFYLFLEVLPQLFRIYGG